MSCPLTWAHTSGAGLCWRLQPALEKSIAAASGSNTAARDHLAVQGRALARPGPNRALFCGTGEVKVRCSGSFLNTAGADALRANAHVLPCAVHQRAHPPQIRIPPAPPRIVRVADHVPKVRHLAAQLTLHRHNVPSIPLKKCPESSFSFYQTLYRFADVNAVFGGT